MIAGGEFRGQRNCDFSNTAALLTPEPSAAYLLNCCVCKIVEVLEIFHGRTDPKPHGRVHKGIAAFTMEGSYRR